MGIAAWTPVSLFELAPMRFPGKWLAPKIFDPTEPIPERSDPSPCEHISASLTATSAFPPASHGRVGGQRYRRRPPIQDCQIGLAARAGTRRISVVPGPDRKDRADGALQPS